MSDFVGSDHGKHPGSSFRFPVLLPEKIRHPVSPLSSAINQRRGSGSKLNQTVPYRCFLEEEHQQIF